MENLIGQPDNLIDHPGIIIGFTVVVIFMLLLDLGIFNKKNHVISNQEAAIWSIVWIGLSMIFSVFIYIVTSEASGLEKFSQYQEAYWIETGLSVDNLFVFILVFGYFNVPEFNPIGAFCSSSTSFHFIFDYTRRKWVFVYFLGI